MLVKDKTNPDIYRVFILVPLFKTTSLTGVLMVLTCILYSVVENENRHIFLVPKIHRCYKKYVSNELFSKLVVSAEVAFCAKNYVLFCVMNFMST